MGKEYKNYKKTSLHRVKDRRKYYKGREGKTEEIKRALGHRARLRKQYFKILRNEGEDIPNKSVNKDIPELSEKSEDIDAQEVATKKPLSYQERMNITRRRKEIKRVARFQKTKQKMQSINKKEDERAQKRKMIMKGRTKRGQPLMAPRITILLEKIKKEMGTS
ncbi:hypothetical protein HII12_001010 [Brettanomyces bruxellensis]|uniref:rRNA-processing protein FYV7 n=1 Tax=Dekkera bruxellensis TaxID=5007 RepID=A0A8H6BP64_DEKBR|nr:hypothetical protein HII12_001010 [Brettanomyces bruxellensis]